MNNAAPVPTSSGMRNIMEKVELGACCYDDGLAAGVANLPVQSLVLLKTHRAGELLHVEFLMTQSPHVSMDWMLGEWIASSDVVFVT
ncbi:hypothetical protein TNCV_1764311 [Trichonephila clavipes]|nr:hypothetical protein TNCV_1764311 [Trichonephila clavipes]